MIELYCSVMEEIKKRTYAINSMLNEETNTGYQATNCEFMCLQIRKILELISMGSLVANENEFKKQGKKYSTYWKAELILNDIEKLNPYFYPRPVCEKQSGAHLEDIQEGYLTRKEFEKVYEKCGKMMHAENPFGSKIDYTYYNRQIQEWNSKLVKLLNNHIIKLIDDDNLYIIHMQEQRDDKVHGYVFGKIE